jgi:membrane protein CcdC involved in cytochrome C biogenesis
MTKSTKQTALTTRKPVLSLVLLLVGAIVTATVMIWYRLQPEPAACYGRVANNYDMLAVLVPILVFVTFGAAFYFFSFTTKGCTRLLKAILIGFVFGLIILLGFWAIGFGKCPYVF